MSVISQHQRGDQTGKDGGRPAAQDVKLLPDVKLHPDVKLLPERGRPLCGQQGRQCQEGLPQVGQNDDKGGGGGRKRV